MINIFMLKGHMIIVSPITHRIIKNIILLLFKLIKKCIP